MAMTPEMRDLLTAINDLLTVPEPAEGQDRAQLVDLIQSRATRLQGSVSAVLELDREDSDTVALLTDVVHMTIEATPVTYPVRTTESED